MTVAAPPSSASLLRAGLADFLVWAFGTPGGRMAFSAIFALISGGILALGIVIWRERQ